MTTITKSAGISVIIYVYNHEKYIGECIDSILEQTLQPQEIIICDDHSTDKSWQIIQGYEKKHTCLVKAFRHSKNMGMQYNANFGVHASKGELFSSLGGDDYWLPEKLEKEWEVLRGNPLAKIAYSNVITVDAAGKKIGIWFNDKGPEPPSGDVFVPVISKRFFPGNRSIFRNQLMYRSVFDDVGGYDETIPVHVDWDLRIRITAKYKVVYSGEVLTVYRIHNSGIHKLNAAKIFDSADYVIKKNIHLLEKRTEKEKQYVLHNLQSLLQQEYEYSQRAKNDLKRNEMAKKSRSGKKLGDNLIFLISQPRAGSTLLQRILGGHSQIHTLAEPWIMLHPLYALKNNGIITEYDAYQAHAGLEDFIKELPNGEHDYTAAIRKMANDLYDKILSQSGKQLFLDKTPRYYFIIDELYRVFPQAKFVFLLRNPLAVLSSILNTWVNNDWNRLSLHKYDLLNAPQLLLNGISNLEHDAIMVRYENMVADPKKEIDALCKKLGIKFEPEMINYGKNDVPKGRMGDGIGIHQHQQPVKQNIDKWIEKLKTADGSFLAQVYLDFLGEELIENFGYSYKELNKKVYSLQKYSSEVSAENMNQILTALGLEMDVQKNIIKKFNAEKNNEKKSQIKPADKGYFEAKKTEGYFQPKAGNTEKYINVKPIATIGNPVSSFQALKNYAIRDFGVGLNAAIKIASHVVLNKFQTQWAGKSDFWQKTIVLPVNCKLTHTKSGKSFAELKPQSLLDINQEFAATESERLKDIDEYVQTLNAGQDLEKPLYISGRALNELMLPQKADRNGIYMLDGARRISAAALAHQEKIEILLVVHEQEYSKLLPQNEVEALKQKMGSLSWFKNYQSVPLIGLQGERTLNRFALMDMNLLQDQIVMDFGCNIGQVCIKAVQSGAKQVVGVEGMPDTFNLAVDIKNLTGFENLHYLNVDFNHPQFDRIIDQSFTEKADYSIFFSVYRTKELKQRDRLFQYIINKTKKGIFFEGHAHPKIDTIEYYDWLFESFNLKHHFLGFSEGNIRPLFYLPVARNKISSTVDQNSVSTASTKANALKKDHYLVSAIISTYKSEKFIEGKLQDLLNQTLGEQLEIIVINSGSPENEKAIVEKYRKDHKNIKYLRTENRETVYQAWNRGINIAQGKYITNANTDDRLRKDALEILAVELENDPGITLIYGDFYITGYENQTFDNHIRTGYSVKPDFGLDIMLHGCHMGPQPMWRKSIHDQLGFFDESLNVAGDYEMWCRLAAAGHKMKHIPEFLGLYLHNETGIVNQNQSRADQETQSVREKYKDNFPPVRTDLPTGFYYCQPVQENKYVNICMVTYNRLEFTKQALASIVTHTRFPYVITVVDNNSTDGSKEYLQAAKDMGIIKNLILLEENIGVAKASNLAWRQEPQSEYYLKYDNDIVIQKSSWLENMVLVTDAIPEAGAVAYNFEPKSYPLKNIKNLKVRPKAQGNLGGACILIPKRTEKILGYWCEDYGLYSEEDADYGFRIQLSNLLNIYMEDEEIGIHLPAGKAAEINDFNFNAQDGIEENQYSDYREWKDEQRRLAVSSGLRDDNFVAYENGAKSLYVDSSYCKSLANKKSTNLPKIGYLAAEFTKLACPQIRLVSPLRLLHDLNYIEFVDIQQSLENNNNKLDIDRLKELDVLILQRNITNEIPYSKLIELLGDKRPFIVYEFDDAFDRLEKEHPAYEYYQKQKSLFYEYIKNADLVTVSTEQLKKYYSKYNKNLVVLPNVLNEKIWKHEFATNKKSDKIKILFSGTLTHKPDLAIIEKALIKILKEYEKRVELILWGDSSPELENLPNVSVIKNFKYSYREYAEQLKKMLIDFAVVPLKNNTFNKAKSYIKWLEYSACKIPGIYTNIPAYRNSIKNKVTGVVVTNEFQQWYNAIRFLITNPQKRKKIGDNAHKEVLKKHTLEKNIYLWKEAYFNLLEKEEIQKINVSIIIPVFNKLNYTQQCIDSLLKNTDGVSFEIIIINNASSDKTAEYLKKLAAKNKQCKIVTNTENIGFARANNQGAQLANGEYLLFLNNDTEVKPGWLPPLIRILDNDSTVAAVGSKLVYPDGRLQHAGVVIVDDRKSGGDPLLAQHNFYQQPGDLPDANEARTYQALTAACLMVRKETFEKVGRFDSGYVNGYEDVDLCFKFQEEGYQLVYQPQSVVIHHESKSGPERWEKVKENINRLHKKWLGIIEPDIIINPDGKQKITDAGKICKYHAQSEKADAINTVGRMRNDTITHIDDIVDVSIIMLTFNALEYTKKCIQSIQEHTQYPHEIIFVDNGSRDGTKKYLKGLLQKNKHYKLISNTKNLGFAAGNNQGVKKAKGKYILLLNNDVEVSDGWLESMVRSLELDEKIGMVGPITNMISGRQQVVDIEYEDQQGFHQFARKIRRINEGVVTPRRRIAGYAILMKKSLYNEVDGFDESLGTGNYEDDDLCLRVREKDFAIMVDESTFINHYGSQTFAENKIDYLQSLKERRKIFEKKWPNIDYDELIEIKNPLFEEHEKQIAMATQLLIEGKGEEAGKIFRRILTDNPISGEALLGSAYCARNLKNYNDAIVHLKKLTELQPDNVIAFNQLGLISAETNDLENAKIFFTKAIETDPKFIDAQRNFADVLIQQEQYEDGIKVLNKILENHPEDVPTLIYLAQLFIEAGKKDEATENIRQVLTIDPENEMAKNLAEIVELEYDNNDDDAENLLLQGQQKLEKGEAEESLKVYQEVLNKFPGNLTALYGSGLANQLLGKNELAKELYNQIIHIEPQFVEAYNNLGSLLTQSGEYEAAIEKFQRALELDSTNVTAQLNISDTLVEAGKYEEGIQTLMLVLKSHPNEVNALLRLGNLCLEAGKFEEAAAYFDKVLEIDPDNDIAKQGLAIRCQ